MMMTGNKYKILLFVDLILSWSLLDPLEVVCFEHGFDSPESCSICCFLAANPIETDTAFSAVVKPYFVYPYVISEGRPQAIKELTFTAGTRGPPFFPLAQELSASAH